MSAMTTLGRSSSFQKLRTEMKNDPESYEVELQLLYRNFKDSIQPFEQQSDFGFTGVSDDSTANKELADKAFFLAQLCPAYPRHLYDFPDRLVYLLHRVVTPVILSPSLRSLRFKLTQSLILLINKNVVSINKEFEICNLKTKTTLLALFMKLQTLNDRNLKKLAYSHVILAIKKHKNNHARNKTLQNVVLHMLQSGEEALARRSLVVLCNLHRMNVWSDELISNAICRACHHPTLRQAVLSFLFSYQMIEDDDDDTDASSNEDEGCARQTRVVLNREQVYKAHHKGTTSSKKKKKAKLKREIRSMKRQQRLSSEKTGSNHYSPLSDLHDADAFVDELYSYLHRDNRRVQLSEVNMMTIIVIARTIGLHRLIKPEFYCFLGKYMMPHVKEITKLLAAAVEVFHADVPDDDVKPLFLQIVNNFVHNKSQPEAFAVGLNAVREICLRMPWLMNDDLLQELVLYEKEKVKAISLAAHSLHKLFKEVNPSLLAKKHRRRFATNAKPKQYGEASVATDVPGADLLRLGKKYDDQDYDSIEVENDDDAEDDDDGSEDAEGDASDEDAEDDAGDEDAADGDDDVTSFKCLGDSAVNECCAEVESKVEDDDSITAGEEVQEDDVEMEGESSSLIESNGSHVQNSGERKRKYADFDQQLDTAESDFRALKKLTVRKSEHLSEADDHFYSNEEFQKIKKLLATQPELRKSSDQLSLKPVNPAKLEANIRRKMTKEEKEKRMKEGREDRKEYKSRAAVKQNKKGGSSNRQKDHKKIMPIAAKRGKIARSKQEKKRKQISSGKQFRGKKAWK